MKVGVIQPAIRRTAFAAAVGVNLVIAPKFPAQAIVPASLASPPPAQATTGATAEEKRFIVTGSSIPTAEEDAPNQVDTDPQADIAKLSTRNANDLVPF